MKNEKPNSGKRKSGKGKKVALAILGVLLAILIAGGVFLLLNPTWLSHIKAAFLFLTSSKENLESNIEKIEDERIEAVQNSGLNVTKDAEQALANGLITSEQFQEVLLGRLTLDEAVGETQSGDDTNKDGEKDDKRVDGENQSLPENNDVTDKKDKPNSPQKGNKHDGDKTKPENSKPSNEPSDKTGSSANKDDADEQIAALVTKMYVLKSNYVGQIEGVVGSMKSEFYKLPAEQRTKSAKQSIASRYLSKINAMEAQCDAQVNAVVTELRQLLTENGRDHSLANAIISTYNAEKENTKAYYISTYGD